MYSLLSVYRTVGKEKRIYRCIQDLERSLFVVKAVDYFSEDMPNEQFIWQQRNATDLIFEIEQVEFSAGCKSLQEAIAIFDQEWDIAQ